MQITVKTLLTILICTFPLGTFSLYSEQTNPLLPSGGNLTATPLLPPSGNLTACHLDLSSELFGGVSGACSASTTLDRSRCCPVLAAWLFAAYARFALQAVTSPPENDMTPLMPDDSQKCVDLLHDSLESRNIRLARVNESCDTVLCYCGIRLHQIGSLSCPVNMFNVTASDKSGDHKQQQNRSSEMVKPLSGVKELEKECVNASYHGCTRCLQSLEKLMGRKPSSSSKTTTTTDRATKMFNRDCQLMGLTWLLAKNKTLYIPTVSAVLRAVLYSVHPPTQPYKCSPDQENMPLAVDSLQFQKVDSSSFSLSVSALGFSIRTFHVLLLMAMFVGLV